MYSNSILHLSTRIILNGIIIWPLFMQGFGRLSFAFIHPTKCSSRTLWTDLSSNHAPQRTNLFIWDQRHIILSDIDLLLESKSFSSKERIEEVIRTVDQSHFDDIQFCSLFDREIYPSTSSFNSCDGLYVDDSPFLTKSLSTRTSEDEPILSKAEVEVIRSAANSYWNRPQGQSQSSRFTYQRKGNYEVHLVDLAKENPSVLKIMNESLRKKIYPLVRREFTARIPDLSNHQLCVYDSLVIRYNATEALSKTNGSGAGQPLHRDLGLVSVNIMLNSPTDFEGGGTFFENQLQLTSLNEKLPDPMRPVDVGYPLLHLSNDRHAGALTKKGIRDIMVIFITATKAVKSDFQDFPVKLPPSAPLLERSARLKSSARIYCEGFSCMTESILCRILHYRLALLCTMTDGEAWHYLGMSLREFHKAQLSDRTTQHSPILLDNVISCLQVALHLNPCDARIYNSFALSLETLKEYYESNRMMSRENESSIHLRICQAYERCLTINNLFDRAGCDIAVDYDSACLNYGLYLSKLDIFDQSANILQSRFSSLSKDEIIGSERYDPDHWLLRKNGNSLLAFCLDRRIMT